MKFTLVSKNWKENWDDKEVKAKIQWAEKQGLKFKRKLSGDHFGISSDFLVLSEQAITEKEASNLVEAGYFELTRLENGEGKHVLIKSYEEKKGSQYNTTILHFKNKKVYEYIYEK